MGLYEGYGPIPISERPPTAAAASRVEGAAVPRQRPGADHLDRLFDLTWRHGKVCRWQIQRTTRHR
eukprot:scaffold106649_cov60-Phaeocystis_antarctica.AAC.2